MSETISAITPDQQAARAAAIADWWTSHLDPKPIDNGDATCNQQAKLISAIFGAKPQTITPAQRTVFRETLYARVNVPTARMDWYGVGIVIDYWPCTDIADALTAAGIEWTPTIPPIPIKTRMEDYDGTIRASCGYGAPYETVWEP